MSKRYCTPADFFPQDVIDNTYSFVDTLTRQEILDYRRSYKRELNRHEEGVNELPPHTVEKRRCFLYITAGFDKPQM